MKKISVNKREIGIFLGGFAAGAAILGTVFKIHYKKKYKKDVTEALDRVNEAEKMLKEASAELEMKKNAGDNGNDGASGVKIEDEEDDFGELTLEEYKKLREGVQLADRKSATSDNSGSKRSSFRAYTDYYRGIKGGEIDENLVDPAYSEHPEDDISEEGEEIEGEDDFRVVDSENEDAYASMIMTEEMKKGRLEGPKIISMDAFDGERNDFDKVQLYYYTDDEVLADENEDIIDNEEMVVGDALDKYDFRNNDDDYICVRNVGYSTDYIIKKVLGSYEEMTR